MNLEAAWLGCLGVLVLGITSLVALGLRIARRTQGALLTFAVGLLGTAVLAAVAMLSFLERGRGFYQEGSDATIVIMALSLLLAGTGQFIAALRIPGSYGVAFAWAAGSMVLLASLLLGRGSLEFLSLPGVNLGLALSLLLAVLSLMSAVVPRRK
jgi:hypothetical protein